MSLPNAQQQSFSFVFGVGCLRQSYHSFWLQQEERLCFGQSSAKIVNSGGWGSCPKKQSPYPKLKCFSRGKKIINIINKWIKFSAHFLSQIIHTYVKFAS
jgi:hypothetical protein